MDKRLTADRWIGPLDERLSNLRALFEFVASTQPVPDEIIAWVIENTNADDKETIERHIGFLRSVELLAQTDGAYELTTHAASYLETEDPAVLFQALTENVAGFQELLDAVAEEPLSNEQMGAVLRGIEGFSGDGKVATRHREWLQFLGFIQPASKNRYELTIEGWRLWLTTCDFDPYIESQLEIYSKSDDRQEKLEEAAAIANLVEDITAALIDNYDGRIDTQAISTLRRITQVRDTGQTSLGGPTKETKKERIRNLAIPDEAADRLADRVTNAGLVGGGMANIEIPDEHEEATYDFLDTMLTAENPSVLNDAVDSFAALDISNVKAGVLSPILYCLNPGYFPIINKAAKTNLSEHFGIEITSDLDTYSEFAKLFRTLRDELELGGGNDNLRDLDWFLYTLEESTDSQLFQIPLTSGGMKDGFEATVLAGVETAAIEDYVATDFDIDHINLWGTPGETGNPQPGDWLLFADRDAETYITAAKISPHGVETLSTEAAEAVRDAVGWEAGATYPRLLYLDTIYQFEVPVAEVWDVFGYKGFPNAGFNPIATDRVDTNIRESDDYGSVEEFIRSLTSETTDDQASYYALQAPTDPDSDLESVLAEGQYEVSLAESDDSRSKLESDTTVIAIDETGLLRASGVIYNPESEVPEPSSTGRYTIEWIYTLPPAEAVEPESLEITESKETDNVVLTPIGDPAHGEALHNTIRDRFRDTHQAASYESHSHEKLQRLLEAKQQLVFYGPPGTGKTFTATRFAEWLRATKDMHVPGTEQIRTVTFHPSFSYEDFLEGFTASVEGAEVAYEYADGSLKSIVDDAMTAYQNHDGHGDAPPFMLLIDEINRGNLAKIFGETITLLEADKRKGQPNEITAELAHSGEPFVIPPNLYLIGTMNTADESIALIDTALRRRFRFLTFPPQLEIAMVEHGFTTDGKPDRETLTASIQSGSNRLVQLVASSILALEVLNERILNSPQLGRGKQLGHTYLLNVDSAQDLVDRWQYEILPQLEEYYFGQFDRLKTQLFADRDIGLFDWETNQIAALTPDTVYTSLCAIAGIDEETRAPLATTPADAE